MSEVKCEITDKGYVFAYNDKTLDPITDTEELAAVDIAHKLGVEPKLVADAKFKARQNEIEKEISWDDISQTLDVTIKKDKATKVITFACMLLSQTEEDQFNVGLQAESSAGKSYIPIELAGYFPSDEVIVIASASPTAFFHDKGTWDEERSVLVVDLEGKILVFLDQPHFQLLEKLRPLLSHDRKELEYKITDKSERKGLRTKNVVLRGYPSVIFCTVKLDPDEQEKTRLFLLSPEIDENKLKESIELLALKRCNSQMFTKVLETNVRRKLLKERIQAIRNSSIRHIVIPKHEDVINRFKAKHKQLKPRVQRDFPRIISLIKAHALLNCFNRNKVENETIEANEADVEAGFALYEEIAEPNELGLPPYALEIFKKVFVPLFKEYQNKTKEKDGKEEIVQLGIDRKSIERKYFEVYHKPLPYEYFKRYLKPSLESAGLITEEPDPEDKRRTLYYPAEYRGKDSGVKETPSIDAYPPVSAPISSQDVEVV
jgi:hypothetical protein